MYRSVTLVLPAAHDDVFDDVVAGACGPDRIVVSLTLRQWEYRLSARTTVEAVLGGAYLVRDSEPPHLNSLVQAGGGVAGVAARRGPAGRYGPCQGPRGGAAIETGVPPCVSVLR